MRYANDKKEKRGDNDGVIPIVDDSYAFVRCMPPLLRRAYLYF